MQGWLWWVGNQFATKLSYAIVKINYYDNIMLRVTTPVSF